MAFIIARTAADPVPQVLEAFLAMYAPGPQNNIHIPVAVHVRHHQLPVFDAGLSKLKYIMLMAFEYASCLNPKPR